jgi:DNA-binding NarL/FixJ family response regulator
VISLVQKQKDGLGGMLKFLVADDHRLIREGLRYTLESAFEGLSIVEAMDGTQVLQAVADYPDLDLILLDYFMPETNGFVLVSELYEHHPNIPVVVLSGSSDLTLVHKLLECGASGFLSKMTDHGVILGALQLVLSGGIYVPPELTSVVSDRLDYPSFSVGSDQPVTTERVLAQLTQRQYEVLQLMTRGKTNKDISRQLGITESTIKVHVTAILRALGVSNRIQAVLVAQRLGLSSA